MYFSWLYKLIKFLLLSSKSRVPVLRYYTLFRSNPLLIPWYWCNQCFLTGPGPSQLSLEPTLQNMKASWDHKYPSFWAPYLILRKRFRSNIGSEKDYRCLFYGKRVPIQKKQAPSLRAKFVRKFRRILDIVNERRNLRQFKKTRGLWSAGLL